MDRQSTHRGRAPGGGGGRRGGDGCAPGMGHRDQMYCPGTGLGRAAIKLRSQMAEMAAGTGARDYI